MSQTNGTRRKRILYQGAERIAGVDEVGRACLAGPVVAAAVVLPRGFRNPSIKDSKMLSQAERERLAPYIKRKAIRWAVIAVGPRRIETLNIAQASRLAMSLAVKKVQADADLVLVDGNMRIHTELPQQTIVGGDACRVEIAAASIIAKVWRDNLMRGLIEKYPHYGFESHVGYPTPVHRAALREHGPCRLHRKTFGFVRLLREGYTLDLFEQGTPLEQGSEPRAATAPTL